MLKWIVLAYVPLFLVFGVGLLSYEIYYKRSLTGGKSKRFKKLVASLEVPGASRTPADVKNIYQAIVESEFLKPYPYSKLATICRACELLELKPHEAVFSEGDSGDHFFVLIKGTVDVYVKERTAPHKMKCVNTLHDSGSFGELALLQVPCFTVASPLGSRPAWCKPRGCLQEAGKRSASVISKTETTLIVIHREAFQNMIAADDESGDLVPVSSQSIAARAIRTVWVRFAGNRRGSTQERSASDSPEPNRSTSLKHALKMDLHLKDNFSASQMSRTDVAYHPDAAAPQRSLLERAVTARATMKSWCELRAMDPMAFVSMPLPLPLQELQVRVQWRAFGCMRVGFVAEAVGLGRFDLWRTWSKTCGRRCWTGLVRWISSGPDRSTRSRPSWAR